MNNIIKSIALAALLAGAAGAQAASMAHAHMGHVMTGWNDTPDKAGLLPVAEEEARIALQHATFAASRPDDLKWMKTHTLHVMHALDPSVIAKGPGKGYGVIKAAGGVAKHIGFAAASADASQNVKAHAVHVSTTAENTVARVQEMLTLAQQVLDTRSVELAADRVARIRALAAALTDGEDGNGDGKITWHKGEGGLAEARKHMGFMMAGEGI